MSLAKGKSWHTSAETVVAEKGRLSTVPDEFLSLWPV
jgi:hypothetical protein